MSRTEGPILVLGAGINGAAIARELALAGESVVVVDTADIASGTTAYSSRLIHGGLRYLEYREFDLVRESLNERTRLLGLAPDFVRPIELFIPVANRFGGLGATLRRFVTGKDAPLRNSRGVWLVRAGLWFYDRYARDKTLPRHAVHHANSANVPHVDSRHRWLCSYWDAQIAFPERFCVALLKDAQQIAATNGTDFRLLTYHAAQLNGREVTLRPNVDCLTSDLRPPTSTFQPAAVINATGAWVDDTLRKLHIDDRKLIAGTKGTHLFTWNRQLADLLGGRGIYFEADDRRLIFLLPLVGGTFIGTTDLRFEGDPATARAEPHEIEYLLAAANELLSGISLSLDDVDWHCCGVRPLPHVQPSPVSGLQSPASITRRHWLHEHPNTEVPFWSVIGGKLTTCRSLAEETVEIVLARWDRVPNVTSRERPIPDTVDDCHAWKSPDGTRDATFVHQVIETEWATTLGDLVERRLMLLYDPGVTRDDLKFLAGRLVDAEKLDKCQMDSAVENCERRLKEHFGLTLKSS